MSDSVGFPRRGPISPALHGTLDYVMAGSALESVENLVRCFDTAATRTSPHRDVPPSQSEMFLPGRHSRIVRPWKVQA
jgi:hypothetical protein